MLVKAREKLGEIEGWGGSILRGRSSQRRSRFERATQSLATFVRSHRSLSSPASQHSASLGSLAPFTGLLTHCVTPSWDS